MAMLADTAITERQKRVLLDVYTSFVKGNEKTATNGKPAMTKQDLIREVETDDPSRPTTLLAPPAGKRGGA
jgi:hypothetical protein